MNTSALSPRITGTLFSVANKSPLSLKETMALPQVQLPMGYDAQISALHQSSTNSPWRYGQFKERRSAADTIERTAKTERMSLRLREKEKMANHQEIFALYHAHANEEKAVEMSAYMRNLFPYLGLPKPLRKKLQKEFFKTVRKEEGEVDWAFVGQCWQQPQREFHYLALEYLQVLVHHLGPDDIPRLRALVVDKSWWDSVDQLDGIIGDIALRYPKVNKTLLKWSLDKNIWLRRIAIDHQLSFKDKTDAELLKQIIINNLGQKEFFINKAIGWSLREYSKTNPAWVQSFIEQYGEQMASLSVREASKHL